MARTGRPRKALVAGVERRVPAAVSSRLLGEIQHIIDDRERNWMLKDAVASALFWWLIASSKERMAVWKGYQRWGRTGQLSKLDEMFDLLESGDGSGAARDHPKRRRGAA